jgi:hypothetical protein
MLSNVMVCAHPGKRPSGGWPKDVRCCSNYGEGTEFWNFVPSTAGCFFVKCSIMGWIWDFAAYVIRANPIFFGQGSELIQQQLYSVGLGFSGRSG